ncbi:hypothetical protein HELRODRAFT_194683 [Helobdella robusta]|uniref:Endonuclease/exonuclease/phosphatase domain-containing protein n=1 Tax=Helobdella robusta TaxID=6412 RepID=T1FWB2_HELRO|nr:hypothetical protein HELRODRAFT_194683 [Helobdella robusta]ESN90123.1 hypothetical protein HELRODRAFT_194683 [Helobdella robusta]
MNNDFYCYSVIGVASVFFIILLVIVVWCAIYCKRKAKRKIKRDQVEISRLGRKSDEEKSRIVLVQFSNYTVKNLILNNCAKLKKSLNFNKVIINHDLSREDRISNRKILEEKKKRKYIIVKLCVSNRVLNIFFVYRSPNFNVGNNDLLLKLINDVLALPGETLLFGDFNFPDINWDTSSFEGNDERVENRFLNLLKDKFLIQHINHPTRFRDDQTSSNSDHSILEFKVTGFCCSAMECDKKYCFDLGDYINFRNVLGVSLQNISENVIDRQLNNYNEVIEFDLLNHGQPPEPQPQNQQQPLLLANQPQNDDDSLSTRSSDSGISDPTQEPLMLFEDEPQYGNIGRRMNAANMENDDRSKSGSDQTIPDQNEQEYHVFDMLDDTIQLNVSHHCIEYIILICSLNNNNGTCFLLLNVNVRNFYKLLGRLKKETSFDVAAAVDKPFSDPHLLRPRSIDAVSLIFTTSKFILTKSIFPYIYSKEH